MQALLLGSTRRQWVGSLILLLQKKKFKFMQRLIIYTNNLSYYKILPNMYYQNNILFRQNFPVLPDPKKNQLPKRIPYG